MDSFMPIEGFDRDKVHQVLKDEGLLDETHFGVACFAAFGYRVREPRPKSRQNLEEVVEWVK
jgi:nitroreductase